MGQTSAHLRAGRCFRDIAIRNKSDMLTAMIGAPVFPRARCCSQKCFRDIAIREQTGHDSPDHCAHKGSIYR